MKKLCLLITIFLVGCSSLEESSQIAPNNVVINESKVVESEEVTEKTAEELTEEKIEEDKESGTSSKITTSKIAVYQKGIASNYGNGWDGKKTTSGEKFDNKKFTAAHKTLPFGTIVRVTNPKTGKSVDVRINDRGPFVKGRIIDLSNAAFSKIASLSSGLISVEIRVIKPVSKK